uniref:Cyclic GMP-AMP synthase n=1 Tax=Anas platyrhynchos TaxID=8839 RepID=A0A8B9THU4_ANAPL
MVGADDLGGPSQPYCPYDLLTRGQTQAPPSLPAALPPPSPPVPLSPACCPGRGRGPPAPSAPRRPAPCSGSAPCSAPRPGRTPARTARPGRPPPAPGAPCRCRRRRGCRTAGLRGGAHRDTETSAPGWGRRRTPRAAPTPPQPRSAGCGPRREQPPPPPRSRRGRRRSPAPRSPAPPRCPHNGDRGWVAAAPGGARPRGTAWLPPGTQHPAPSTRHPARPRNGKRRPKEPPRPAAPGRPSAAARPGRGRPARAAPGGGRRPGGSAESGGEAAVAVPPLRLRAVLSQLSLGRRDVSEASGLVNQVVSHLIQAIRGRDGGFGTISRLGAGSYYERVKISEPNEFDIMLVMPITYYYLTFKRNPKEKYLNRFLDEDGKLSADKMLTALRKIIKEEVKNIKDVEVTVKRRKARSPAITLLIKNSSAEISVDIILALEVQQSWPPSTQDGLNIERWLGRKVRRELRNKPIYLVANKKCSGSLVFFFFF